MPAYIGDKRYMLKWAQRLSRYRHVTSMNRAVLNLRGKSQDVYFYWLYRYMSILFRCSTPSRSRFPPKGSYPLFGYGQGGGVGGGLHAK
jgi:hypothetical protein